MTTMRKTRAFDYQPSVGIRTQLVAYARRLSQIRPRREFVEIL